MRIQVFLITVVILFNAAEIQLEQNKKRSKRATEVHSCSNMVYCQGNLLDTVQRFRLHPDSKQFVDMTQINAESVTLENFEKMMKATNNKPTKNDVLQFVDENFIFENEADYWTPNDFKESPAFLDKIQDSDLKKFAKELVSFWPILGRRVKDEVKEDQTKHSLIPVPEGYIVPGGRFREVYYWDSYWIIKGLLLSEMKETVKGMLDNFIFFIKHYGMIPNGSRIYYLNRSQPPLFTAMVGLYMDDTGDTSWLRSNIEYIEKELLWWLNQRTTNITINGVNYQLAYYGTDSNTPRPESYAEDLTTCAYLKSEDEKSHCYNALKTGAETGWDFSSRWIFDANGSTNANLTNIDSKRAIPVDLNAFLCKSFKLLSGFYGKVEDEEKKAKWANYADTWLKNIQTLLYNENDGIWYDYDRVLLQQRKFFYPSNFAPLWADCYDLSKKDEYGKRAAVYLNGSGTDTYLGGIPTSLQEIGEQWDMPNAWPPLQELVVLGLYKTGNEKAVEFAKKIANRWIASNLKGYSDTQAMFEKYDAIYPGKYGGGGEYAVQVGFGWSNGVVLSFINEFSSARMPIATLNSVFYFVVLSLLMFEGKLLYL